MPATYEPIGAIKVLGSAVSNITFSSIPTNYTDLILVCNIYPNTNSSNMRMTYNSDSGSNYSVTYLGGNGSTPESGRASNQTSMDMAYLGSNTWGNVIIQIQNYSNATTSKTAISRSNGSSVLTALYVGLWRSNAAINSITLTSSQGSNIAVDSTFSLYGIKAA